MNTEDIVSADKKKIDSRNSINKENNRFIVPCIFLLALGFGNLLIGHFKYEQYEEIISDLEIRTKTFDPDKYFSPMQRLKSSFDLSPRTIEQGKKAQARRDFYQLVQFGGRVFIALAGIYYLGFIISNKFL